MQFHADSSAKASHWAWAHKTSRNKKCNKQFFRRLSCGRNAHRLCLLQFDIRHVERGRESIKVRHWKVESKSPEWEQNILRKCGGHAAYRRHRRRPLETFVFHWIELIFYFHFYAVASPSLNTVWKNSAPSPFRWHAVFLAFTSIAFFRTVFSPSAAWISIKGH